MKGNNRNGQHDFHNREKLISWWDQEALEKAKIMIVGAGAIGNETLKNLALMGIGNLFICDMDDIEDTNLSRTVLFRKEDCGKKKAKVAAHRVSELSLAEEPKVDYFVGDITKDLGRGVYRYFDLILGCVDNVEARLFIDRMCAIAGKIWINAGIHELALGIEVFDASAGISYHSVYPGIVARERQSCLEYKKRASAQGRAATVQIASAIVAGLQVQEAIKILTKKDCSVGKKLYYEGSTHFFLNTEHRSKENSIMKGEYIPDSNVIKTEFSSKCKLRDFIKSIADREKTSDFVLELDKTFVAYESCRKCGKIIKIFKPHDEIYEEDLYCTECDSQGRKLENSKSVMKLQELGIQSPDELLDLSLEDLGIMPLDIVKIWNSSIEKYHYYELTGDKGYILPNIFGEFKE